jgi:hypothetical protein
MTPRIVEAKHVGDYRVAIRYEDGIAAVLDLESELWGETFEPLRDPAMFRSFRVDPFFHTLVWPNGADLAPEFLYEKARA